MSYSRPEAVVIGASIAGLACARVLAERFTRVTLLDRDVLPDAPVSRRGVPQDAHGHLMLTSGQEALELLFPGLLDELVVYGAVPFDPGADRVFWRWGEWARVATPLRMLAFSRPLLEWALRQRVRALPGVRVRRAAVAGLMGGPAVTGVVLADGEELGADLVVDASGRGGRSGRWLAALGHQPPPVTEVGVGVGYATRLYRRERHDMDGAKAWLALPAPPDELRGGMALPIEGDRWLVSMSGWHGDYPGDDGEFLAHAKGLPLSRPAEIAGTREALTSFATCGFASNRWRRFETLKTPPAGFVVVGDALCSVNPVYGQGMTCAVLQASALGGLLDAVPDAELPRAYFAEAARILDVPWRLSAEADLAWPQARGERPRGVARRNWWAQKVQRAARVDPEVRRAFGAVQHLMAPLSTLRRPGTVLRVLRART
ncbi:FAD-binding monooxygenase [Actinorhabdospora filicis]|uniref:FAD-binding monooxygenase n=1 Tax=Actinorhabdospora filicis TaxID=1785913 RepID=A0A9W6SP27_9ACTN|nr:hypothetical protein [Actinorhabdospora filicis]GLZ79410.1 FAD-binding monooxygenase [Actinorhabdospora filicis]